MRVYGYDEWGTDEAEAKQKISDEFQEPAVLTYELLAYKSTEPGYEMGCWLLLRKDGELYEVESSHCSCYGYEDSFEPTRIVVDYLKMKKGCWVSPSADDMKELIAELEGVQS